MVPPDAAADASSGGAVFCLSHSCTIKASPLRLSYNPLTEHAISCKTIRQGTQRWLWMSQVHVKVHRDSCYACNTLKALRLSYKLTVRTCNQL